MSTAKHTPGAWHAEPVALEVRDFAISRNGVLTDYDILSSNGQFITVVQHAFGGKSTQANARLMAAAPDLLAACEAVLAAFLAYQTFVHTKTNQTLSETECIALTRTAIAKATGDAA